MAVPVGDADYAAWLGAGNVAVAIVSWQELWDVLQAALPNRFPGWLYDGATFVQPAVDQYTPAQLKAYAGDVRWQAEITGTSAGQAYRTDRVSRGLMSTTLGNVRANPAVTVEWKALDGTFTTLDAAQMETFSADINAHVETCFATEKTCRADIDAGTVTTLGQIDALFAPLRQLRK